MNTCTKITLAGLLIALISGPVGSASAIVAPGATPKVKLLPRQVALALLQIGIGSVAYILLSRAALGNIKHVTDEAKKKIKPQSKEVREAIDKFGTLGIWGLCFAGGGFALMWALSHKSKHIGEIPNHETKQFEPASINDVIWGVCNKFKLLPPEHKGHEKDDCCKSKPKIASVDDVKKFIQQHKDDVAVTTQITQALMAAVPAKVK